MGEFTKIRQNLCHTRTKRMVLFLGMFACIILVFHTFTLPLTNLSPSVFPTTAIKGFTENNFQGNASLGQRFGKFSLLSNSGNVSLYNLEEVVDENSTGNIKREAMHNSESDRMDNVPADDSYDVSDLDDDETGSDTEVSFNLGNGVLIKKIRDPVDGFIELVRVNETESNHLVKTVQGDVSAHPSDKLEGGSFAVSDSPATNQTHEDLYLSNISSQSLPVLSQSTKMKDANMSLTATSVAFVDSFASDEPVNNTHSFNGLPNLLAPNSTFSSFYSVVKKKRRASPILSIADMNKLLLKNRASFRTLRPRWSATQDQQILAIRSKIDKSPIVRSDKDLYEPAFRNISTFKRSYELMERTLKVYVYREGNKPIFHQPLLKGIYASEGWFMKLMEGNRRFVVKDPKKAYLFYMPFSSRFLEFSLYVPNSHNRRNLRSFLGDYVSTIAAKYPYWNRTGGTDHFLVACHDWAPYETKHVMDRPIRALCNADLSNEFRLGKDVSLPETYVRFGRDPLKDIGGNPPQERHIFAFYAGSVHGYLRPILLEHWENKDPEMKILGPMPPGINRKMTYIKYMKSSKYCICPRGYEVNSPRIVEAIFYECVPVIISDNYVPPFFEVLNWEAFSVFIAEADIPKLKDILLSITEEKYMLLHMGVKRVQKHFLWHPKTVKYDLFHMILHSIWYNRVYTLKPR